MKYKVSSHFHFQFFKENRAHSSFDMWVHIAECASCISPAQKHSRPKRHQIACKKHICHLMLQLKDCIHTQCFCETEWTWGEHNVPFHSPWWDMSGTTPKTAGEIVIGCLITSADSWCGGVTAPHLAPPDDGASQLATSWRKPTLAVFIQDFVLVTMHISWI